MRVINRTAFQHAVQRAAGVASRMHTYATLSALLGGVLTCVPKLYFWHQSRLPLTGNLLY